MAGKEFTINGVDNTVEKQLEQIIAALFWQLDLKKEYSLGEKDNVKIIYIDAEGQGDYTTKTLGKLVGSKILKDVETTDEAQELCKIIGYLLYEDRNLREMWDIPKEGLGLVLDEITPRTKESVRFEEKVNPRKSLVRDVNFTALKVDVKKNLYDYLAEKPKQGDDPSYRWLDDLNLLQKIFSNEEIKDMVQEDVHKSALNSGAAGAIGHIGEIKKTNSSKFILDCLDELMKHFADEQQKDATIYTSPLYSRLVEIFDAADNASKEELEKKTNVDAKKQIRKAVKIKENSEICPNFIYFKKLIDKEFAITANENDAEIINKFVEKAKGVFNNKDKSKHHDEMIAEVRRMIKNTKTPQSLP